MAYLDVVIIACDLDQNPDMMGGQDSRALTLNRVISFAHSAVAPHPSVHADYKRTITTLARIAAPAALPTARTRVRRTSMSSS
jgi:hypothetical protein